MVQGVADSASRPDGISSRPSLTRRLTRLPHAQRPCMLPKKYGDHQDAPTGNGLMNTPTLFYEHAHILDISDIKMLLTPTEIDWVEV